MILTRTHVKKLIQNTYLHEGMQNRLWDRRPSDEIDSEDYGQ